MESRWLFKVCQVEEVSWFDCWQKSDLVCSGMIVCEVGGDELVLG